MVNERELAVIKALTEAGCLNWLPETDQLCLF